jgi:hypothetical protein
MEPMKKPKERIEALEALLRRLCSQDLTLAESKRLRIKTADLLGSDTEEVPRERGAMPCALCSR